MTRDEASMSRQTQRDWSARLLNRILAAIFPSTNVTRFRFDANLSRGTFTHLLQAPRKIKSSIKIC